MAFIKKHWKNRPDKSTPLSAAGMNDLEERITKIDNVDVGLGNVLDLKQASIFTTNLSSTDFLLVLPSTPGQYLIVSSWSADNVGAMWIASVTSGVVSLTTIKDDPYLTITKSVSTIRFAKTFNRIFTVTRLY